MIAFAECLSVILCCTLLGSAENEGKQNSGKGSYIQERVGGHI